MSPAFRQRRHMPANKFRKQGILRCLIGAMLLTAWLLAPCRAEETNVTEHFILYSEGIDAADTLRLLEASYPQMKTFFNSEPDRKMQVKVFATKESYQVAFDKLRKFFRMNTKHRAALGIYTRTTATSYLWVQPDEYFTRRVLLHEVAHQFHDLVRPWSHAPSLDYCGEGLAEYFSWHNWDGKVLELGIAPQIAPFNYVEQALRQLRSPEGLKFESVVYGDEDTDYALAWALVAFLIKEHPKQFHIWRIGLDHGVDPKVAWQKRFGDVTPAFVDTFENWLKQHSQPWQVLAGQWQPWGAHIEGNPAEFHGGQALLAKIPRRFEAEFVAASNAVQGITFGYQGGRNFFILERQTNQWEIAQVIGTEGYRTKRQTFPASGEVAKALIQNRQQSTLLTFDDHAVEMTNVTGRVGLWVDRGKARFLCTWE